MEVPFVALILAGVTGLTLALSTKSSISQLPPSTVLPTPAPAASPLLTSQDNSPKRLTIAVSVAQPEDLKVKEGLEVKAGDLIADRDRERSRLESQRSQLDLTLKRLKPGERLTIATRESPENV